MKLRVIILYLPNLSASVHVFEQRCFLVSILMGNAPLTPPSLVTAHTYTRKGYQLPRAVWVRFYHPCPKEAAGWIVIVECTRPAAGDKPKWQAVREPYVGGMGPKASRDGLFVAELQSSYLYRFSVAAYGAGKRKNSSPSAPSEPITVRSVKRRRWKGRKAKRVRLEVVTEGEEGIE
jgi:hypothetical protein